jgi:hypothetical protein
MNTQQNRLNQRRKTLIKRMTRVGPFIEGTLSVTQRMCGSTGCVCHRGKKHSAMYLTWKEDQESRSLYIPVRRHKDALAMSRNYKKLKQLIRKLSDLHKKVLIDKK